MRKIIAFWLSLIILTFSLCLFANCVVTGGKLPNVIDNAGLLTDIEKQKLTDKIDELREKYDFDIVLHTTNSIGNKTIAEYAANYYDYNGYGVGNSHDGLLFMLNMDGGGGNRDYYTSTTGFGITAFSGYAIADNDSCINKKVLRYLGEDEYYEAFDKYLNLADKFLKTAKAGRPYSYEHRYISLEENIGYEIFIIAAALVIAFIIVLVMKKKMNNAVKSLSATEYVRDGSVKLTTNSDVLVNVKTTKKPVSNSRRSMTGRTGSSFGGTSHGGGGGKF